jgi:hypothetical protein
LHVFRRFLCLAVLLTAPAGAATGQSRPDVRLPEPCRAGITQDLPALEKRKKQLERQILRSLLPKTLHKRQEELLRVIFQIECLKAPDREEVVEILATDKAALRSEGRPRHIVEVTTYYATNRNPSGSTEPARVYGARVAPALPTAARSSPFPRRTCRATSSCRASGGWSASPTRSSTSS